MTPNIHTIIRQHVSLEVRCIDRVYLHAYMPKLQTSGGLCYFLHDYLGYPVPSPALLKPRHDRFVAAVQQFAATQRLEVVPFERGESKDERVAKDRARFTAREGVVFIGVAQEKMRSFKAHRRQGQGHTPVFDFSRQSVAVNHYYFYVHDRDWGPAFLKIGTYLPYPVKLCLNGQSGSSSASVAIAFALRASTMGFSPAPTPPPCRPPAMRSAPPTSRPSLTAGRSDCRGR